jgi:hypothetical protein
MEDNTQDVESTEVVPSREPAELSIRESLSKQLKNQKEEHSVEEAHSENTEEGAEVGQVKSESVERIPLAPPADMNAMEKDAFLNPSPEILFKP